MSSRSPDQFDVESGSVRAFGAGASSSYVRSYNSETDRSGLLLSANVSPRSVNKPMPGSRSSSFLATISGKGSKMASVYVGAMKRNSIGRFDETIFGAKQALIIGDMEDRNGNKDGNFLITWYRYMCMYFMLAYRMLRKQTLGTWFRHTIGIFWAIIVAIYSQTDNLGITKLKGDYVILLGALLGFLVAFRTNQGYMRYLEGRHMWGVYAFNCVALISQAIAGLDGVPGSSPIEQNRDNYKIREDLKRYLIASAYGLKALLRDESVNSAELEGILTETEVEEINNSYMWPSSYCITKIRKSTWSTGRDLNKIMEKSTMNLEEAACRCYVIRNNQFPIAYAFILQATVYVYMWGVPLYFASQGLGWFLIPPSIVLNQLYAGMIDISDMLDDPFGTDLTDLNLDFFCHTIKQQVVQAVAVQEYEEFVKEIVEQQVSPAPMDNGAAVVIPEAEGESIATTATALYDDLQQQRQQHPHFFSPLARTHVKSVSPPPPAVLSASSSSNSNDSATVGIAFAATKASRRCNHECVVNVSGSSGSSGADGAGGAGVSVDSGSSIDDPTLPVGDSTGRNRNTNQYMTATATTTTITTTVAASSSSMQVETDVDIMTME